MNTLVKEENVTLEEACAIRAKNRQALIDFIHRSIDSKPFTGRENEWLLCVGLSSEHLACEGLSIGYKTEADIPYHSVPCPCGNPKHWLIKYEEEESEKERRVM